MVNGKITLKILFTVVRLYNRSEGRVRVRVCWEGLGGGGASYVSKGAYRTVFKNLIRLKFNKRISHQISNSNVFEMYDRRRFIMPRTVKPSGWTTHSHRPTSHESVFAELFFSRFDSRFHVLIYRVNLKV